MESCKDRVRVPMLESAEQWATWEYKITIALKAGDVYNVVKGTEKKPEEGGTDYAKKLTEWEKKDFKAQRIITETVSDDFTIHLLTCTTSKEIWDKMHSVFERQSESNKHALQQKFFAFQKNPNDNIAMHISRLNKLVLQLRNVGVNIDESMVVTRIIMTLPSDYRHFGSSWEATAENDRTLQNLTNRLLAEETRLESYEPNEVTTHTAFFSGEKQPNKKGKPGKCFKCGQHGHWKAQCDRKTAAKGGDGKEAKSFIAFEEGSNILRENVAFICQEESDRESFALDSAASKHMCNKRAWFTDYIELRQPSGITIGNGEKIYAIGRGSISIKSFNGKEWINATLYDVLYVPKLHTNLFSSLAAMDKGCKVYSDRNKCEVTKGRSIVAVGARNGNLFQMKFKVRQPELRRFAIVDIDDDNLVEANRDMATNENIAPKSTVDDDVNKGADIEDDVVHKTDDASQSSVYTTASDGTVKSDDEKDVDSPNQASVHQQQQQQIDLQSQQIEKVKKISSRRTSTVCDVVQENIISSRLRGVREAAKEKSNDETDDTAFLAIVDQTKKKKRKRHGVTKKYGK